MTLRGFICLVFRGGGRYSVVAKDYVPTSTDDEWAKDPRARDGRPKPTGYYRTYVALCQTCGEDIRTHL